jgi:TPR repeat protein
VGNFGSGTPDGNGTPTSGADRAMAAMDEFIDMAEQAKETGDLAGQLYASGVALIVTGGDKREAFRRLEEAARLGHVEAMHEAGNAANDLGDVTVARFWWEAATKGGNGQAAQNIGASEIQAGRIEQARPWFLWAAQLGNAGGYAALTQVARDAGDHAQEEHWSRLGAEAGHPFCMLRFGAVTMRFHGDDPQAVRTALPYLERAGEQGEPDAMFLAGLGHSRVGERNEARQWLLRAEQAGHPRAREALNQFGL